MAGKRWISPRHGNAGQTEKKHHQHQPDHRIANAVGIVPRGDDFPKRGVLIETHGFKGSTVKRFRGSAVLIPGVSSCLLM